MSSAQMERTIDERVDHRVCHTEAEYPSHTAVVHATDRFRERVNYEHHLTHRNPPEYINVTRISAAADI